jgi:4-diphosphocytidyl-2-C-methyl-D-erythritol kinase
VNERRSRLSSALSVLTEFSFPIHRDFSSYPNSTELEGGGFALSAPAKINLALRVIGRRPDGYHEIETLYQEISLCDRIEFRPSVEWRLEVRGSDLVSGESNLVTKAARLLSQRSGIACAARIVLHKEIPVAGGLGGGSSDAAVTLIGLCRLWGLAWGTEALAPLAAELGADCRFFLTGGLACGSGRGEIVEPLPGRVEGTFLLVVPDFGVSSGWAYEAGGFRLTDEMKSSILQFWVEHQAHLEQFPYRFLNDLENVVLARYPELRWIKQKLLDLGAEGACLSGSGSVLYGLFSDQARALRAAQEFGLPNRVIICRAVSRPRRT